MPVTRPLGLGRLPRALLFAFALVACALVPGLARAHPSDPVSSSDGACQVKAAFLLNFIKFVDWPADTSRAPAGPWQVAVLGDSCFAHALSHLAAGRTVKERSLTVRSVKRLEDAYPCHALFIGSGADALVPAATAPDSSHAVLTVGEPGLFERSGGMIWFVVGEDRVRFAINKDTARQAGLRISSKLLDLAVVVRNTEKRGR